MSEPTRIQRKRTKGWRKPEGAVYVGRPSKWGNPFEIGLHYGSSGPNGEWSRSVYVDSPETATAVYQRAADLGHPAIPHDKSELRGKDLMCWCPLDRPCHADMLLEIANRGEAT